MRHASLLIVLLLTSAGAQAQQNTSSTRTILTEPPTSEACPISFSAERRSPLAFAYASRSQQKPHGQGLQLTFIGHLDTPDILRVGVRVHGISNEVAYTPASTRSSEDLTESFQLQRDVGAASLRHSSLWTNRMAGIRWVELTDITYADGVTWHESNTSRCRATPNSLLLVAAAH